MIHVLSFLLRIGLKVIGGIANRILFIDANNKLAQSAKLVFDGTHVGIGTDTPTGLLHVKDGTLNLFEVRSVVLESRAVFQNANNFGFIIDSNGNEPVIGGFSKLHIGSFLADPFQVAPTAMIATFDLQNKRFGLGTQSPLSSLDIHGTLGWAVARRSSTDTIDDSATQWNGDTTGGGFTLTFPPGVQGRTYRVGNIGSGGNLLSMAPNGLELLEGVNASLTLADGQFRIWTYDTTDGWW